MKITRVLITINIACLAVGVLVYLVKPPTGFMIVFNDSLAVVASVLAFTPTLAGTYFFHRGEPQRTVWLFLGLGLFLWGLGEFSWWILEVVVGREVPYPSVADLFWLIGYPFLLIGFILNWRQLDLKIRFRTISVWIIGLGITTFAAFIFIMLPILVSKISTLEKFLGLAYPVGDVLILGAASLSLTAYSYGVLSRPWKIIVAGFVATLVADLIYSFLSLFNIYQTGNPVDLLWIAGYLIIGIGALNQIELMNIEEGREFEVERKKAG